MQSATNKNLGQERRGATYPGFPSQSRVPLTRFNGAYSHYLFGTLAVTFGSPVALARSKQESACGKGLARSDPLPEADSQVCETAACKLRVSHTENEKKKFKLKSCQMQIVAESLTQAVPASGILKKEFAMLGSTCSSR